MAFVVGITAAFNPDIHTTSSCVPSIRTLYLCSQLHPGSVASLQPHMHSAVGRYTVPRTREARPFHVEQLRGLTHT
jgi:hypothetical protein